MYTFGQLKTDIRSRIFPAGEAENLIPGHDKAFIDALIEWQTWVECAQVDNTTLYPQCATLFNCGLTVFQAPRGIIRKLKVVDRLDQSTYLENPDAEIDWCSEVHYRQTEPCHVQRYLSCAAKMRACPSIPFFFGIPASCCGAAGSFISPTDEDVDPTLPILPVGYHYPQESTNKACRASSGIWAIERGKIFIAPWIQSTETVIVEWDGIKRTWGDADPIDDDPLLAAFVEEWVRADNAGKYEKDMTEFERATLAYKTALSVLIHQCHEETRVRGCEASQARGSNITQLFYNEAQSFTANCPEGQTGSAITVNIIAGSMGSSISVADANQKAKDEAQRQAEARLDCTSVATTYTNDQQSATVFCSSDDAHPAPDGNPVTVIIQAGIYTSQTSKEEANALALAAAQTQAANQLSCTYWNSEQSYTATCAVDATKNVTATTPAHTYSSTISQSDADTQALDAATNEANTQLAIDCPSTTAFFNTEQMVLVQITGCSGHSNCPISVVITVRANKFSSSVSQADANQKARNYGQQWGAGKAGFECIQGHCNQTFTATIP